MGFGFHWREQWVTHPRKRGQHQVDIHIRSHLQQQISTQHKLSRPNHVLRIKSLRIYTLKQQHTQKRTKVTRLNAQHNSHHIQSPWEQHQSTVYKHVQQYQQKQFWMASTTNMSGGFGEREPVTNVALSLSEWFYTLLSHPLWRTGKLYLRSLLH